MSIAIRPMVMTNQEQTPYGGLITPKGSKTPVPVYTGPHVLVSGMTGSGKTRKVLGPGILLWKGPVIASSSKGDLAELTIRDRARRGPVYLMDLSGEVRESELQGVDVIRVVSDPAALIDSGDPVLDDDAAFNMASLLSSVGSLGANDSGGGGGGDSAFWATLAQRVLAALIRSGGGFPDPETGEMRPGGGIRWVLEAATDPGDIGDDDDEEKDANAPIDLETPNWDTAFLRATLQGSKHAKALLNAKKLDPKQRDSILINCMVALNPWVLSAVSGDGTQRPFTPVMLADPTATLYLVSPGDGAAAGAACAVIESQVRWMRKRVGQVPRLLWCADELPNGVPVPPLRQWVGEARSLGIAIAAGVQSSSQFEPRYGAAGTKILREIMPAVCILPGAPEWELLDSASKWSGAVESRSSSTDQHHRASQSTEIRERLSAAQLLPRQANEGRLLLGGQPGTLVRLPDISKTGLLKAG